MQRTIIVGDVHGCRAELEELLSRCQVTSADRVVLVGDLVAKGPDSRGVVRLARENGFAAVLGNHDAKVVSLRPDRSTAPAESEVAQSVAERSTSVQPASALPLGHHARVAAELAEPEWQYLVGLPLYLPLAELGVVVVHAGLVPGVPLSEQPRKYLLNLRSITPAGEPSKHVEAGAPWASLWPGPEHVVFGHDAIRGLQQHRHATGLDTGCVYGRQLTAIVLPEGRLVSVPARETYVSPLPWSPLAP